MSTPHKQASISLLAQKGNFMSTLSCTTKGQEPWITDSGASDHMTGCSQLFTSYVPNSGSLKVRNVDGSFLAIAGNGTIEISPNIILKYALHVPKLSYNFLSVSKKTRYSDDFVNFLQSTCEF